MKEIERDSKRDCIHSEWIIHMTVCTVWAIYRTARMRKKRSLSMLCYCEIHTLAKVHTKWIHHQSIVIYAHTHTRFVYSMILQRRTEKHLYPAAHTYTNSRNNSTQPRIMRERRVRIAINFICTHYTYKSHRGKYTTFRIDRYACMHTYIHACFRTVCAVVYVRF